ncbi:transcription-repair coupling factor [Fictibacillus barbaricus]|uniref:Transcription-repair-coupling factor n=1 Tax=Fictibacillus barbaricus TaxID=182136 RepID=A0ABS2Z766_9BACL|nr:transcription-repair coupling factor [Fictibacillus barbaricus]MBN3543824.1 transcription-repair coupling factor [Fictibacillus barbaricus]GGB71279.1 transcription-repair-coupling factor [Fictibacillus barbaricus]
MLGLKKYFSQGEDFKSIVDGINAGLKEQLVAGLSGSARTMLISSLHGKTGKPQLVVTHNLFQAQKLYEDLTSLLSEDEVYLYPVNDLISSEMAISSPELKGQRIEALNYLSHASKGVIITPVAGLRRYLPPVDIWKQAGLSFRMGEDINPDQILNKLVAMGYERTSMVQTPGEFSVRGGIIDIYPLTEKNPVRIELFDTEVDSIRYFEAESQRSQDKVEEITIAPAEELILFDEHYDKAADRIEAKLAATLKNIKDDALKETLVENISYETGRLREHQQFQSMYKYASLFYDNPASLLNYISSDSLIIMDEIGRIQETSQQLDKEEAEWQTALLEHGELVQDLTISPDTSNILGDKKAFPIIYLSLFLRHVQHTQPQNILNVECKSMQNFHGQMNVLKGEMDRWKKLGFAIVFVAMNKERANRLERVLADYEMDAGIIDKDQDIKPKTSQILLGDLGSGFESVKQKLVVITEEEVFTKKAKRPARKQRMTNAERIKSYSELKVGDYVVHVNHGIGKYLGIETLEIKGVHKDYLHIKYSGNDKLYVPVEQIDQVQKYVGSEGKEPKIYSLGGSDWKKVKSRVKSSVQDIADDLIKLYAEREASRGYAFAEDGAEQSEFEGSFPYQETDDQLRAIEEIKKDMESIRPMDRLLCGDVGYGKTEVAIRAAFKAIMDGKQVAFLVPTTILAQQHYETFRERFSEFPISIGSLSRFRSKKEQNEVLRGLKAGTVDIAIGTHRLLSKDVQYKDLGLLIIDEEQRFGVTHKEKIKTLKSNVDVLTLTATPIPRTLHMSMLGVRDLSVIETPPENRFPVQTYVMDYNGSLVREAIEREMGRGGQVYFLYNRVDSIERMAEQISMLVPDCRVAYAHGQMSENELESVMLEFLEGNFDVLVSTTIIETGVDIPNVNTLIVYDADKMGLSQLYQLRGRVGRSNRVAYAYFTYQRDKVLTEVAEKRLQAIKEFTELGSGFKIAMRDLSIRGAGNLLGAQQHGFIDSVGFDLYSQMLEEAIQERKGTKPKEVEEDVELNVEVDAYIPTSYIGDEKQKIEMYKHVRAAKALKDISDLQEEFIDRFGDYPVEVECLLLAAGIKLRAKREGVRSIEQKQDTVMMLLNEKATASLDGAKMFDIANKIGRHVNLGMQNNLMKVVINRKRLKDLELLKQIDLFLKEIKHARKEKTVNTP